MPAAVPERRPLSALVLAAGEGTRMRSQRPKPLHRLCGRPMVVHVLYAVAAAGAERAVVVVGHGAPRVTRVVGELRPPGLAVVFVEQARQRGTGDAVLVGLTGLPDDEDQDGGDVLVLPGDTPLLSGETIATLVTTHQNLGAAATLLTARLPDATGYGRVVRGKGDRVARVVEQADATPEERAITEVNTSVYVFRRSVLAPALRRLSPDNAAGEYYLTDIVAVLHDAGYDVASVVAPDPIEATGVNDRLQLAAVEAQLRLRINAGWLRRGVTMLDADRTYIDTTVELAADVTLYPGTLLQGSTTVASGAEIGPDSQLADCVVGARAVVTATVGRGARVGADAQVGPWAYLPPGSAIAPGAVTGACFTGSGDRLREPPGSP